jgi:hypothetical protein
MPYMKKQLYDSSRLDVVEIARVAWLVSFQPLLQENTCNSAHKQTPLTNDTIDSVLRHREVGRAKDLISTPLCYNIITPLFYSCLHDSVQLYVVQACSLWAWLYDIT